MESLRSNSSSAEANHLGPQASADELARAVDRSLCERSSGIRTDGLGEPAVRMGGSASGSENYPPSAIVDVGLRLLQPPPRARVWEEERHRYLPAWSVRRFYRLLIAPTAYLHVPFEEAAQPGVWHERVAVAEEAEEACDGVGWKHVGAADPTPDPGKLVRGSDVR